MKTKRSLRPSVLNEDCASRRALDRIADKWTALIVRVLANGTRRHSELRRAVTGISQKMLTQTLRSLEDDGLVARKVYPVIPPRVEYSLTPLGRSLTIPLQAICKWAEEHVPQMEAARAAAARKTPTR